MEIHTISFETLDVPKIEELYEEAKKLLALYSWEIHRVEEQQITLPGGKIYIWTHTLIDPDPIDADEIHSSVTFIAITCEKSCTIKEIIHDKVHTTNADGEIVHTEYVTFDMPPYEVSLDIVPDERTARAVGLSFLLAWLAQYVKTYSMHEEEQRWVEKALQILPLAAKRKYGLA